MTGFIRQLIRQISEQKQYNATRAMILSQACKATSTHLRSSYGHVFLLFFADLSEVSSRLKVSNVISATLDWLKAIKRPGYGAGSTLFVNSLVQIRLSL